jgi:hypothetical protein
MPLRTRRSLTRGTPRGLLSSIGLMAVHSWSVEFVTHDSGPPHFGTLNHGSIAKLNRSLRTRKRTYYARLSFVVHDPERTSAGFSCCSSEVRFSLSKHSFEPVRCPGLGMRHVVSAIYRFWWCRSGEAGRGRARSRRHPKRKQLVHFCRRIDKLKEKRSPTPEV